MTSVIELYEQISSAPDEKTRARLIVEAIEHVERRFPAVNDLATNASLRDTELRLQKEIEQLRAETRQMEGNLRTEMKQIDGNLRTEMKRIEGNLSTEMKQIEGNLRAEMGRQKVDTIKWTLGALLAHTALILGGMRYFFG